MIRKIVLLLLLFSVHAPAAVCAEQYMMQHIGLREGISNGFVLDLAEDRHGFIWVATEYGLNRIAGKNVKQFKKNNSGLSNDVIHRLYYDREADRLWIVLRQGGVDIYDCEKGTFSHCGAESGLASDEVRDVKPAAMGGLWILHYNGAIQHYDTKKRKFTTFHSDNRLVSKVVLDGGNNRLYVGHATDGLSVLDLKTGRTRRYVHNPHDPQSLPGNNIREIYSDRKKNIWIGTNAGLSLFYPETGKFQSVNTGLAGNNVFSISEIGDELWICSDLGGISILAPDSIAARDGNNPASCFRVLTPDNSDLSSPNVRKLIEDMNGNIWIANYSTGVDIYSKSYGFSVLPSYDLVNGSRKLDRHYGMAADKEGNVWIGGENRLTLLADGKVKKTRQIIPNGERTEALVYAIMADAGSNLWLGMNDAGVIVYSPRTDSFTPVDLGESMLDIHAFWQDNDGKIWIGSENGVFTYDCGKIRKEDALNDSLTSKVVYALCGDAAGNIWIGSIGGGLDVFNPGTKQLRHVDELPSNNVNHIIIDDDDEIWVASYDGVVHFRHEGVRLYDDKDGLADNNARALAKDRSGNIWVSTYTGISRIGKNTGSVYNYNYDDGVPLGGFVEGGVCSLRDGTLMFSSPTGVCSFNPQLIDDEYVVSPIEIIDCERLNANSYRISFTVSNYAQTGQVEYAYRLDGTNGSWHSTEGETQVSVRDIPPGKYTFKVKARWKNGDWDEAHVAAIPIEVEPPLWGTWWAKVIYMLIISGIIFIIIVFYKRHLQQKNSLEMERNTLEMEKKQRRDEQNLNSERLRFYTNIAHEIRTPLTLIIGPLEDLMNDAEMPSRYSRKVGVIHQSAQRLLNLVNQIMDFRKTETQNRQLCVAKGNLSNLVKEIGLRYKELNRNDRLSFNLDIDKVRPIFYDGDIISTILNNLLSNAVKYTPEGEIRLSLKEVVADGRNVVVVRVSDTGYGIEQAALPHIFDRYFQAEGKHQASGTGIGLALVKSLAEIHKGTISVESKVGVGTTFTLSLPASEIYPDAKHREESASPAAAKDEMEAEESADGRPLVLIVEDNADIRDYVAETFGDDYRIAQGKNGKEGLAAALEVIPDIIVSDIMMPEMDGIEMCRRLKADVRTCHIPVVLLTAKDSLQDKEAGYECGADSYLTKPFTAKLLTTRIRNLLDSRRRLARMIMDRNVPSDNGVPSHEPPQEAPLPKLNKIDEEFLKKLTTLIEENLDTERLDMNFITERMNMSYSSFYRKMKALTGVTANEYIRKVKLSHSVRLMLSGEYNISEAATLTGFNNLGHFRDAFREEFGMSPSQYLKEHKQG